MRVHYDKFSSDLVFIINSIMFYFLHFNYCSRRNGAIQVGDLQWRKA